MSASCGRRDTSILRRGGMKFPRAKISIIPDGEENSHVSTGRRVGGGRPGPDGSRSICIYANVTTGLLSAGPVATVYLPRNCITTSGVRKIIGRDADKALLGRLIYEDSGISVTTHSR